MKKVLSAVLAAAMTLSFAACSSGGSGAPSAGSAAQDGSSGSGAAPGGKTIKVMLSEEPSAADSFANTLKAWEEATGNKAEIMVIPYDDQLTKFPAMAKNNDLPDLISTTRLHTLYPDEFVDIRDTLDESVFEPTALQVIGKNYGSEKVVGAPQQFTISNMYYNKDAFQKAGIQAPTIENPWTLDELYENAAKLQKDGGVTYGFACDYSRARYDNLMYANGGSITEKSGDTFAVALNSPQNVATLERFVQANNDGVMPKAIWAGGTTDNPGDYFKNGDVGVLLSGSWNYNTFATDITKFQFGVMPGPKGTASQSAILGGSALAVPENAKNKETALEFIKWMYTPENFQNYINLDKGLSALQGVMYQPADEKFKSDFDVLQSEVQYATDAYMVDESSSWRQFLDNEYRDYLRRAVSGELTPQQALDGFSKDLAEKSGWEIKA